MNTIQECELQANDFLRLMKIEIDIDEEWQEKWDAPKPAFTVKVMFKRKLTPIETAADCLISDLKQKFMDSFGGSGETLVFKFQGKELEDDKQVGDCGIQKGSRIMAKVASFTNTVTFEQDQEEQDLEVTVSQLKKPETSQAGNRFIQKLNLPVPEENKAENEPPQIKISDESEPVAVNPFNLKPKEVAPNPINKQLILSQSEENKSKIPEENTTANPFSLKPVENEASNPFITSLNLPKPGETNEQTVISPVISPTNSPRKENGFPVNVSLLSKGINVK